MRAPLISPCLVGGDFGGVWKCGQGQSILEMLICLLARSRLPSEIAASQTSHHHLTHGSFGVSSAGQRASVLPPSAELIGRSASQVRLIKAAAVEGTMLHALWAA